MQVLKIRSNFTGTQDENSMLGHLRSFAGDSATKTSSLRRQGTLYFKISSQNSTQSRLSSSSANTPRVLSSSITPKIDYEYMDSGNFRRLTLHPRVQPTSDFKSRIRQTLVGKSQGDDEGQW